MVHRSIEHSAKPIILFGHTARVWDLKIVRDRVISVSEDSTCRVWDWKNPECIACWEGHSGKNVWCVDVSPTASIVATGGNDSGIRLWNLSSLQKNKIDSESHMMILSLKNGSPHGKKVTTFGLLDCSRYIICTDLGKILVSCFSEEEATMQELYMDEGFSRYSVLDTSECGKIAAVGGINGQVVVISTVDAFSPIKWSPHKAKVNRVFLHTAKDSWYLCSFAEHGEELFVHRIPQESASCKVEQIATIVLPEHFWVTDIAYSATQEVFLLGSRRGALAVYQMSPPQDNDCQGNNLLNPVLVSRKVHGKDAVTSIALDIRSPSNTENLSFGTVGRDGTYRKHILRKIDCNPNGVLSDEIAERPSWELERAYNTKITKGWLERVHYIDDSTLVCGFYDKRFFVYNETKRFEMFSVACGGGHRRWDLKLMDPLLNTATFGFIRHDNVQLVCRSGNDFQPYKDAKLQDNFSGRETRVVRFASIPADDLRTSILITSGEDAVLRFMKYDPARTDQGAQNLLEIRKHISVVRGIAFSEGHSGTLMFTAGAREEMRCWRIDAGEDGTVQCVELNSAPLVSKISETRIMDISVASLKSLGTEYEHMHLIATPYSDTFIRLWLFDESQKTFRLITESDCHKRCVLKARILVISGEAGNPKIVVCTAGTDGNVMIWDCWPMVVDACRNALHPVVDMGERIHKQKMHQSGVNAMDAMCCSTGLCLADLISLFWLFMTQAETELNSVSDSAGFVVLTGGDDNAVSMLRVTLSEDTQTVDNITAGTIVSPHSSGVTGECCVPGLPRISLTKVPRCQIAR